MLDLLILFILIISLIIGAKRGLIVQLIYIGSIIIALLIAISYYKQLAEKFVLWIPYPGFTDNATITLVLDSLDVDQTFYRIFAFAIIFFVAKIALQIILSMLDFLAYLPVLNSLNFLLGAVFCFIEAYILLFVGLYVVALIPLESVQKYTDSSILTGIMLEHTPVITKMFQSWWYIYMK
ncbi:MAG: CvpA family protein [Solibacillus sp.]